MPIIYESYAVSATVKVTAQKKPSAWTAPALVNPETGAGLKDTIQYIGTKVRFLCILYDSVDMKRLSGKTVRLMRQLNTGAWTKVADVTTDSFGYLDYTYTLAEVGVNSFRAEWDGDAVYAGCDSKAVKSFARHS